MEEPERFGSQKQEDFNSAYRQRPILNAIVSGIYLLVFLFVILAVVLLFSGQFLKSLGSLFLGGVAFVCWAILHNWALVHPK